MKKLFIYYSLTGNGDLISQEMKARGYKLFKLEKKKRMPRKFFFRIMSGGFLATLNIKSRLKNYDFHLEDYDEIVVGSPIWNARLSTPINTLLAKGNFSNKKVSFLLYSGSGEGVKAIKKINKLFPESKIVILQEPLKHNEELKKIDY